MCGRLTRRIVDELMQACDKIHDEYDACSECPLASNCLRYETIEDIWSEVSESRFEDFLEYADDLDEEPSYDEWIAELQRGFDRDRL